MGGRVESAAAVFLAVPWHPQPASLAHVLGSPARICCGQANTELCATAPTLSPNLRLIVPFKLVCKALVGQCCHVE